MNVVPFACSECGASFHELEGGICLVCGRLLCGRHLTLRRAGPICRRCLGEDDVKTTFESSVSNEDQQRVVRLLEMDVAATIGDSHRNEIAALAKSSKKNAG